MSRREGSANKGRSSELRTGTQDDDNQVFVQSVQTKGDRQNNELNEGRTITRGLYWESSTVRIRPPMATYRADPYWIPMAK